MEQRRLPGNSQWYHETQTSLPTQRAPLVPEAADIEDRFLLGLGQQVNAALNTLLLQAEPALHAARQLYRLLFPAQLTTSLSHTLTLYDRLSTALIVAQVAGVQRLCNHYAARLNPLPGPDSSRESNQRLTQITEYARQLASQPTLIDAAALQRLDQVGLTAPDIITFNQIIGFVSCQARVVAGVHAFMGLPVRWIPGSNVPADAEPHRLTPGRWQPALPPLEPRYAAAEQLEAINASQPLALPESAGWLLAHDGKTLSGWSALLTTLSAASASPEATLAAAVASRINGSSDCFNRYPAGALRDALAAGVEQALALADPTQQAVIALAAQLTRSPDRFSAAHLQALRDAGLSDSQTFDVLLGAAAASWGNRLMQGLGSPK